MSPESTHHHSAITSTLSSSMVIHFSRLPIRFYDAVVTLSLLWEVSVGGQASVLCLKSHNGKTNKLLILHRGDKKTPDGTGGCFLDVTLISHLTRHARSHTHTPPQICVALM